MRRTVLMFDVDGEELACRIAEAAIGIKRPSGMTARQALDDMRRATTSAGQPDMVPGFERAAQVAAEYIAQCAEKGRQPS